MKELDKYESNLKFYTLLKYLIQMKLTSKQLSYLIEEVLFLYERTGCGTHTSKKYKDKIIDILNSEKVTGKGEQKKQKAESIITLIEIEEDETYICELFTSAVLLYRFKDTIIERVNSKSSTDFVEMEETDYLSLGYDESTIKMPYMFRVAAPMVLREIITELSTSTTKHEIYCNKFIKLINIKYFVEVESMFDLIIVESVNQSITSNAGTSYENRFAKTLEKYSIGFQERTHDDRQSAVEYDFIFSVNEYQVGVSAKRTLRERYKQNHRSVNELGVSKMLTVTLGTDLNEAKMENILELQGQYILVASEVYENSQFMKECPRVFSSLNLEELFNTLGKKDINRNIEDKYPN